MLRLTIIPVTSQKQTHSFFLRKKEIARLTVLGMCVSHYIGIFYHGHSKGVLVSSVVSLSVSPTVDVQTLLYL